MGSIFVISSLVLCLLIVLFVIPSVFLFFCVRKMQDLINCINKLIGSLELKKDTVAAQSFQQEKEKSKKESSSFAPASAVTESEPEVKKSTPVTEKAPAKQDVILPKLAVVLNSVETAACAPEKKTALKAETFLAVTSVSANRNSDMLINSQKRRAYEQKLLTLSNSAWKNVFIRFWGWMTHVPVVSAKRKPVEKAEIATPLIKPKAKNHAIGTVLRRLRVVKYWLCYGQLEKPENKDEIEKLVATTWLMRAGVLICVLTAGFLLKLSIDYSVLSPAGRVAFVLIIGSGGIFWGLKLYRGMYNRLGQTFIGLGFVLLYFGFFAMNSMYHLSPPLVCGILMLLVTVAAGLIADRLSSMAIALIAVLGGYGTPIMLATGTQNFVGLYAYMFLLGTAVIGLAFKNNWLPLHWLGMAFAYLLFYLSLGRTVSSNYIIIQVALILFFLQYSVVFVLYQLKHGIALTVLETWAMLVQSFVFFGLNWFVLTKLNIDRVQFAPLPIGLSLFYMIQVYFLIFRKHKDRLLLISCIALAGFYLALTFPVVLSSQWLGACWALQALLMVWLGYSLNSRLMRGFGWSLFLLCLYRFAFVDLIHANVTRHLVSRFGNDSALFWKSFLERIVCFLVPIISLGFAAFISHHPPKPIQDDSEDVKLNFACLEKWSVWPTRILMVGGILLFIYLNIEAKNLFQYIWAPFSGNAVLLVWIGAAIFVAQWSFCDKARHGLSLAALWILILGVLAPVLGDYTSHNFFLWHHGSFSWEASLCRILKLLSIAGFFLYFSLIFNKKENSIQKTATFLWPVLLFLYSTYEVTVITYFRLPGFSGGGVSVLWAVFAFVFVARGLQKDNRFFRYIGLTLFAIITAKVLFWDLNFLNPIYRVVAFFAFGLCLMMGSWLYIKLWKNIKTEPK